MKYILFIVLGLGLTLGSCKKFLQETPTGSLTDQSSITSYPGGVALATGAYRALPTWTNGAQWWGGNLMGALEYATGKAYSQYQAADLYKFETDVESGDSEYFIAPWNNWYRGVRDCNLAIKLIPTISGLTEDNKSKLLGEVRTLRAFYYYCLVRHYGDVVYNTAVLTDISKASEPRSSLKSIYDRIIVPDLEFAVNESKLVDGKATDGRISKYVARMIMADVYLTMSGYPYQEVNADADTAKAWCTEGLWSATTFPVQTASAKALLEKSKEQLDFLYGKYSLGSYTDLNNVGTNNNKGEGIFQVQYLAGTSNNGIVPCTLPITSGVSAYSDEYGTFIPSQAYHDSYDPADKRIVDRQFFYYSDTKAPKHDPNESPYPKLPIPFLYKYYDYAAVKVSGQSGLNLNLYRYADVLLMLTEVNWTLKTVHGSAISDADVVKGINEIRSRALLPGYPTAGDVTLLKIMSERAYELIFENKMLFDQRRTRLVLKDGSGSFTELQPFVGHQPVNYNFQWSKKHLLAPVSSTEIDNNRLCLQNYGWVPKQIGQ
jgi:starch-binding outer membrane protein, SusD/RagB family